MNDKLILRKEIKHKRANMNEGILATFSDKICSNILNWDIYIQAKNIMIFYPIKNEISLLKLLDSSSDKNFYFPSISNEYLYPIKYDKKNSFKLGSFNIPEPIGLPLEDFSLLELVFVPALSVDMNGNRLGYGRGYYDRFLAKLNSNSLKVVPIYSEFCVNQLPCDDWDLPVNFIITEREVIVI